MRRWIQLLVLVCLPALGIASEVSYPLDKAPIDPTDPASLQRGAQIFMNNCLGCHGLKYMRYNSMAEGIGISTEDGEILTDVLKQNLIFNVNSKVTSPIETAMPAEKAATWFGTAPPDLSLVARSRGVDWLYTYLRTFYADSEKTWGVNNLVFPDVGMPHALIHLQGVQVPIYAEISEEGVQGEHTEKVITGLKLAKAGSLSVEEYDRAAADLVNFLAYVGEPIKLERERMGLWVMAFLAIFTVFAYLLKREFWKDVH